MDPEECGEKVQQKKRGERSRALDHAALEDQSQDERGGCDRRSFYARCPCVGMQELEAERCETSLLPHACYSLSMCVLHTSFLLDLLFPTASLRFGLREPAAVGLGLPVLNV